MYQVESQQKIVAHLVWVSGENLFKKKKKVSRGTPKDGAAPQAEGVGEGTQESGEGAVFSFMVPANSQ